MFVPPPILAKHWMCVGIEVSLSLSLSCEVKKVNIKETISLRLFCELICEALHACSYSLPRFVLRAYHWHYQLKVQRSESLLSTWDQLKFTEFPSHRCDTVHSVFIWLKIQFALRLFFAAMRHSSPSCSKFNVLLVCTLSHNCVLNRELIK
jgi:hypothetical protein